MNGQNVRFNTLSVVIVLLAIFSIPLATSFKSIMLPLALLVLVLQPDFWPDFKQACQQWPCIFALLLGLWVLIGAAYSPADMAMIKAVVGKMLKLWYLPVFAVAFYQPTIRRYAILTFLLATLVVCLISLTKYLFTIGLTEPSDVFHNRIQTGLTIAIAAWLAMIQAVHHQGLKRVLYGIMAFLFALQIIMVNTGRTGHVIFVVLGIVFAVKTLRLKPLIIFVTGLVMVAGLSVLYSPMVSKRVHDTIGEYQSWQQGGRDTSIGIRVQFHQYAKSLWQQAPIFGQGSGSFAWNFAKDNPVPAWGNQNLEPHSQYWMLLAENGLIGVLLLMGLWLSVLWQSRGSSATEQSIFLLTIAFILASFSDSLILYSSPGTLFVVLAALSVRRRLS